mmetsp:Transcript_73562/g.116067  ORF Transcript_73562/g.116067 Transcript_73562/m.116067 type:complete len:462 (+) Transcript_73562:52-1437(+)
MPELVASYPFAQQAKQGRKAFSGCLCGLSGWRFALRRWVRPQYSADAFMSPADRSPRDRFLSESELHNDRRSALTSSPKGIPSSPKSSSPCASPGLGIILKSDSDRYLTTSQRVPSLLQSHVGRTCFVGRMERLENMRRTTSKALLIPAADDLLVKQLTARLDEMGLTGKWRIPLEMRTKLESDLGVSSDMLMQKLLVVAQHLAVPVVSVFHVGAAGLGLSGDVYLGTNIEVSSGIYASNVCGFHYTIHAEQAVVLNMFEQGEAGLKSIYISHVPCGMCRQFMAELPDFRNIMVWTPQLGTSMSLGTLLPNSFGPIDLGIDRTLLPWGSANPIALPCNSEARVVDAQLAQEVETAAQRAYAPYTSSYAGAVLTDRDGRHFSGSAVESVAFNPSTSPLQAALMSLFVNGGKLEDIVSACLAEDPSSQVTYKGSDGALLAAVAPWVALWLIPLETSTPSMHET